MGPITRAAEFIPQFYEERQLSMLTWLRLPRTQVIFLTSAQLPDSLVDYYLGMIPGVPHNHARRRLTLLSCNDTGDENLTRNRTGDGRMPNLAHRLAAK